jgi:hypothetical protein
MLGDLSLSCRFSDDGGHYITYFITFYDRNSASRGIDFGNIPENREHFLRYSESIQCHNPGKNVARSLVILLEDIAHGILLGFSSRDIPGTPLCNALERPLRKAITFIDWLQDKSVNGIKYNKGIDRHFGAAGVMSPGHVNNEKGSKRIVASFQHPTSAITEGLKH